MPPELSIVVVHHGVPRVLARCLDRIASHAPEAEVVLVDTAPDEAVLSDACRRVPGLRIRRAPNHSLAHAVNIGLRATGGRLVVHMNADVYLEADTLHRLRAALESDPRAGLAGPLARTQAGRSQDLGPLYALHYARLRLRSGRAGAGAHVPVPWLAGFLQLVRREVLADCGGLDASLRFYNEDLEFCLRARRAGYRCLLVDAPVVHLGGSSTPSAAAFEVEGYRGGLQLSRRFLPRWARRLHELGVLLLSAAMSRWARDPVRREAHRAIGAMVRSRRYDDSPFGATLNDAAPRPHTRP